MIVETSYNSTNKIILSPRALTITLPTTVPQGENGKASGSCQLSRANKDRGRQSESCINKFTTQYYTIKNISLMNEIKA
jgi:hypothetical protein